MSRPPLLIVATSARAIAAAACERFTPLTIDLFADRDTQACAARAIEVTSGDGYDLPHAPVLAAVEALARASASRLLAIYGSGFEAAPALLAAIARHVDLLGCGSEVLRRLGDVPALTACFAGDTALRFPPTTRDAPALPAGWLVKHDACCGGLHVRDARPVDAAAAGRYFQRRVDGPVWSALFVVAGGRCVVCGAARHLRASPAPRAPYAWQGALNTGDVPLSIQALERCGRRLADVLGLRGVFGIDFVPRDGLPFVLDINPRLTASLDVYPERGALVAAHVAACARDTLLYSKPAARAARGAVVLYACRPGHVPDAFEWPEGVADVPHCGSAIAAGAPLVSVIVEDQSGDTVLARLTETSRALARRLAARGANLLPHDITIKSVGGPDV